MDSSQPRSSSSVNTQVPISGNQGQTTSVGRSQNFSSEESLSLLKIWATPETQKRFASSRKRHGPIWSDIASELYKAGTPEGGQPKYPQRDGNEVKTKVNNMKKDYSKIANKSGSEGRPEGNELFDIFDSVLGQRLIVNNPFVTDSIEELQDENSTVNLADGSVPTGSCSIANAINPNSETRSSRKRNRDMVDKDFQQELLSLQKQSLSLAQTRKSGEETLFGAMTRFFDSGASYFDSKIKKKKKKSHRRRRSHLSSESSDVNQHDHVPS